MSIKDNFLGYAGFALFATGVALLACSHHYDKVCKEIYNDGVEMGKEIGHMEYLCEDMQNKLENVKEETEK